MNWVNALTRRKIAFWGYVLSLHIVIVFLVFRTSISASYLGSMGIDHPTYTAGIATAHKRHVSMDAIVPDGAAVFLGDSILESFPTISVEPLSVSFGVPGQRSTHLLTSLGNYASLVHARRIYVMIGTNDVARGQDEGLPERYSEVLGALPERVPVTLISVLPIDRPGIDGRDEAARTAAMHACAAVDHCTFVDAYSAFTRDGKIVPGLLRDGVHPTAEGYRVLRDVITATSTVEN